MFTTYRIYGIGLYGIEKNIYIRPWYVCHSVAVGVYCHMFSGCVCS